MSGITFGREICGELATAEEREWLVTNGLGGYASGTIAGSLTRRYHGLLVAALKPPLGRTVLVSKLDETAEYDGETFALATNRWGDGAVDPHGYRHIESFRLDGTTPVWRYAFGDALLEKRIWMHPDANTTYVRYELLRGSRPLALTLKALVNYRDYHSTTYAGDWRMSIEKVQRGLRVAAFDGATPFYLLSGSAKAEPAHDWYRNFCLSIARYRGLDDHEDQLHAGTFHVTLKPGEAMTIVLSTDPNPELDGGAAARAREGHEEELLERWNAANSGVAGKAPGWIQQLVLAADQFIVRRPLRDDPEARSVIAGYHWFGDWGRDTMISLPGLALTTGRPEIARNILRTFARFVDCGMLPNVFPDAGETPEYNTVDAALWYLEAVRQYWEATGDEALLRELFPVLVEMVEWHQRGTRYQIHVDPADGLLYAGEAGVQLTWMDAKVGDWVVTPRIGKPVEINALWYNALLTLARMAKALGRPGPDYEAQAAWVRDSFQRFWNAEAGYCFDVLDGPNGNEATLRPNAIFAVSLPESPLTMEQQRAVVDVCARHLLTSHGLRSLASSDPAFIGHYGGGPRERDAAYHQGTAWGWLLGPFALAHLCVHGDSAQATAFLAPMEHHLNVHGLGTASEIFDGDPPFTPHGCIAQAWTVAELFRAWVAIANFKPKTAKKRVTAGAKAGQKA
ncbi:MAG TPA: amylo-alpha-1,6-glucosidase [Candidatus Acidoferrales bacterium]|nr:amylo-alpha-1,6-glucosidase [Candidatus Acidoferrales bacterium]